VANLIGISPSLRQFYAKCVIEPAREVGLCDRGRENYKMHGRKGEFESFDHVASDAAFPRPLRGKTQHVLFRIGIGVASLEIGKVSDLSLRESGPPTEGFVVVQSDMTIG
jgi:hypothetical protein